MSDSYISLGYASADEYFTLRGYYQNIIGEYMDQKCARRGFVGELLGIHLGHDHHLCARMMRELCIDVMALLTKPEISEKIESHLQPHMGRLLKTMAQIFDDALEQEIPLDLIAVDHDCPRSFFNDLDEKYRRLYKEAGLVLPDILTGKLSKAA